MALRTLSLEAPTAARRRFIDTENIVPQTARFQHKQASVQGVPVIGTLAARISGGMIASGASVSAYRRMLPV